MSGTFFCRWCEKFLPAACFHHSLRGWNFCRECSLRPECPR